MSSGNISGNSPEVNPRIELSSFQNKSSLIAPSTGAPHTMSGRTIEPATQPPVNVVAATVTLAAREPLRESSHSSSSPDSRIKNPTLVSADLEAFLKEGMKLEPSLENPFADGADGGWQFAPLGQENSAPAQSFDNLLSTPLATPGELESKEHSELFGGDVSDLGEHDNRFQNEVTPWFSSSPPPAPPRVATPDELERKEHSERFGGDVSDLGEHDNRFQNEVTPWYSSPPPPAPPRVANPLSPPIFNPDVPRSFTPPSPSRPPASDSIILSQRPSPAASDHPPASRVDLRERLSPLAASQQENAKIQAEWANAKIKEISSKNKLNMTKEEAASHKKIKIFLVALVVCAVVAALAFSGLIVFPFIGAIGGGVIMLMGALASFYRAQDYMSRAEATASDQKRIHEGVTNTPWHSFISGQKGTFTEALAKDFARLSDPTITHTDDDRKIIEDFKSWVDKFKELYKPLPPEEQKKHFEAAGVEEHHKEIDNLKYDIDAYELYLNMQEAVSGMNYRLDNMPTEDMKEITSDQIKLMQRYGYQVKNEAKIAQNNIELFRRTDPNEVDGAPLPPAMENLHARRGEVSELEQRQGQVARQQKMKASSAADRKRASEGNLSPASSALLNASIRTRASKANRLMILVRQMTLGQVSQETYTKEIAQENLEVRNLIGKLRGGEITSDEFRRRIGDLEDQ